jgi:ABC-type dipeptide/oligopeptide/nickel transport system ATPase subunit
MGTEPIDDIEAWSKKLSAWKRDCLRRLAVTDELTETDVNELLLLVKHAAGFMLKDQPTPPIPFSKAHFGSTKHKPIVLKGISKVENVNRLAGSASLDFCPEALTIIYGRNGSGKTGYVRILRTACRTRIENPAKLKVLGNVHGGGEGHQAAQIIIDAGGGDVPIAWAPGMLAPPELMKIGVFDTASAQLYVDGGSQIRYLPFGLALPHRLNAVCLTLKDRLEAERASEVGNKVSLTKIAFPVRRATKAQTFEKAVSKETSDAQIDKAASFQPNDQVRLDEVCAVLSAGAAAVADLASLVTWAEAIAAECEAAEIALSDAALGEFSKLKDSAVSARQAAALAASKLFIDEPLPGVGSDSWRALWRAARDYSVSEAYVGDEFPVTTLDRGAAVCVLCQQPLLSNGTSRLQRFQKYMDDALDLSASNAERRITDAVNGFPELKFLRAADFAGHLEQIRMRDAPLADALSAFQVAVVDRQTDAAARLAGDECKLMPAMGSVHTALRKLASRLKDEKDALEAVSDVQQRAIFQAEKAELEDRKVLAANRSSLIIRRGLLAIDAAYGKALAEIQTKGITQRANDLVDKHLTAAVAKRFDAERERFDILHLKVGLSRKSGQTKAEFEIDTQTKMTRVTSEVLSEGEQRALALAGFLTEVALTDGSGPIVVDDPVSSLDRDRSVKVAERLVEEACQRQVIVFTHDIIFFNELCRAADERGIEPVTTALFSDKDTAGKIDPAGMVWKGLNVAKRIGRIKNNLVPLTKLHATSPADYEYQIKNLYGRLRDTYERVVEEVIFRDVVRRGTDVIQTQLLRCVTLSDPLAIRFHIGMTRANTHSHDNPAADTVAVPKPDEVKKDIEGLEKLIQDLKNESGIAELARPEMKPKK